MLIHETFYESKPMKKNLLKTLLVTGSIVFSTGLCAADDTLAAESGTKPAAASTSAGTMSKDEWLGKLKAAVPDLICKGFLQDAGLNARLTKLNIDYDKCVTLIPPSVEKCQAESYAAMPAMLNEESAGTWGHTIGECIGKDFAVKYLLAPETNASATTPSAVTEPAPASHAAPAQ